MNKPEKQVKQHAAENKVTVSSDKKDEGQGKKDNKKNHPSADKADFENPDDDPA